MRIDLSEHIVREAVKNPVRYYKNPDEVIKDVRLNRVQKERILDSWEQDQNLLLTAEEENMGEDVERENAARRIQRIHEARDHLA